MPDENDIVFNSYGPNFLSIFRNVYEAIGGSGFSYDSFIQTLLDLWGIYSIVAFLLSALFILGIIYSYIRASQLGEIDERNIATAERLWKELHSGQVGNNRWKEIQGHIETPNPNDWKLAIIEADIMLDEMLSSAGYAGMSVGEKLKSASPQSFTTIRDAWDAHMVRNKIAHRGADFVLTQKIARETILQYQRVFQEFEVI